MANYIRLSYTFINNPRRKLLVRELGLPATHYILKLLLLAGMSRPDGILKSWDSNDIECAADWLGNPGELAEQLCAANVLCIHPEGYYSINNWDEFDPNHDSYNSLNIHFSFIHHPKHKKAIKTLGLSATHHILNLWLFAGMNRINGVLNGWSIDEIESIADWDGKVGELVDVLCNFKLLDADTNGHYHIHDWHEHNSSLTLSNNGNPTFAQNMEERKQNARRAAFIRHHGRDKGLAKYAADKQSSHATPDSLQNNRTSESQAMEIIKHYESKTTKTSQSLRKKTASCLSAWLSRYSYGQIMYATDQYLNFCAANHIESFQIKRSNDFFRIYEDETGFFEKYVYNSHNADPMSSFQHEADECCHTFSPPGNCGAFNGKAEFCKYCTHWLSTKKEKIYD